MHSANYWGGSFEIAADNNGGGEEDDDHEEKKMGGLDLESIQQNWLLAPPKKKNKYVDLGCGIVCSRRALKWTLGSIFITFFLIALPIIIANSLPNHNARPSSPDHYTLALHKALLFFNAQKSGSLAKKNDGITTTNMKEGLVGGYYDDGDNTKFPFPMAFAMSMLSWSVIEYNHKYQAIGEYNHVRDLIKWGTDYLLLTFNSSATKVDKIYSQLNGSSTPNDRYCWQRPKDMDYPQIAQAGPELAGEMAAALAAASIVFRDNADYSKKLIKGAKTVFDFARDSGTKYSHGRGSTGYYDEYMWGAAWLYFATGHSSYISLATNPDLSKNSKAFYMIPDLSVLSLDNKLPAAMLLLTRLRIFLNPGYPYEEMLRNYHNVTTLTMCSYLQRFHVFKWTQGGMIKLNHGKPQPLQYVANAAFLASLLIDYLNAIGVPGFNCGPSFISSDTLRDFSTSQINYILGANPMKMSYVVGYGNKFPRHVHHSHDNQKYSCTRNHNPNNIMGAMVDGPDRFDQFKDYAEPTLAGNAGLVAALVSLTSTGGIHEIDKNTIFSAVPPLYPRSLPPPSPWKPGP